MSNIKKKEKKINIIHFSTLDFGGAGGAAYKFHKNLQKYGMNSILFVQRKTREDESVMEIKQSQFQFYLNKVFKAFENMIGKFHKKYLFYDRARDSLKNVNQVIEHLNFIPDIIIMESITTFVDLEVIYELQKKYDTKVYWYMFDMAPMTGGCHFSWECDGYTDSCKNCPAVTNLYANFPKLNLEKKVYFQSKLNYEILFTVPWLESRLNKSTLYRNVPKHFLTTGTDESIFKLENKNELRKKRNIPLEKKVIFFGALNTTEERKGYSYLIKALRYYEDNYPVNNILLITAGHKEVSLLDENIYIEHTHIGYLNGYQELSEVYGLSDVLLSPVIEDIGPAMINEAMLCGTPVVAFEAGIAIDVVKTNQTGYLAKLKDYKDLAIGINNIMMLNPEDYKKMSSNCREIILKNFTLDSQMKQFKKILGNIE